MIVNLFCKESAADVSLKSRNLYNKAKLEFRLAIGTAAVAFLYIR